MLDICLTIGVVDFGNKNGFLQVGTRRLAKPSGPRMAIVVVGGDQFVRAQHSLSYTSTLLWLQKFIAGWDPPQLAVSQYPPADFRSMNSL